MSQTKQFNTTELDFDKIKESIKTYFKRQDSEFKDWDFEGSGLNTFIDVLAYNTHYNAVNAHVALNESFLDSAQVRSNVIARAKLLGYTPSSVTSPVATVQLTMSGNASANATTVASIPKGSTFAGIVDGVTYSFITLESYSASGVSNATSGLIEFVFQNVDIYEGTLIERKFEVDQNNNNQKFVITDPQIDTQKIQVEVFDNQNSQSSTVYSRFTDFTTIGVDSRVYFLYENHQGYFQLEFGDDVLGKKLEGSNIISVEYLQTSGIAANNIQSFTYTGATPLGATEVTAISTLSKSSGGAEKESVQSIKHKAPLSFISQNRAVSASDYTAIISKEFSNLQSLSVWGGEDNDPPQYGRVYISAKPHSASTLTTSEKNRLLAILAPKKVLAIEPFIVDPDIIYVYTNLLFKYNSAVTTLSQGELEANISERIRDYSTNTLEKFEGVFRYSNFLNLIDTYSDAVTSSNANLSLYKNVVLALNNTQALSFNFTVPLGTNVTQTEPMVSTDSYLLKNVRIFIEDEPLNATSRNLYSFRLIDGIKTRISPSVGTIYPETGKVTLLPLAVDVTQTIRFRSYPRSNDIVAKRNSLLSIDVAASTITGEIDSVAVAGDSGKNNFNTFNRSY
jgi:hypothetical protein